MQHSQSLVSGPDTAKERCSPPSTPSRAIVEGASFGRAAAAARRPVACGLYGAVQAPGFRCPPMWQPPAPSYGMVDLLCPPLGGWIIALICGGLRRMDACLGNEVSCSHSFLAFGDFSSGKEGSDRSPIALVSLPSGCEMRCGRLHRPTVSCAHRLVAYLPGKSRNASRAQHLGPKG